MWHEYTSQKNLSTCVTQTHTHAHVRKDRHIISVDTCRYTLPANSLLHVESGTRVQLPAEEHAARRQLKTLPCECCRGCTDVF